MSNKRSRNPGGGRLKSPSEGGESRQKYDCPCCQKSLRTDKLHDHYINKVIWDKSGKPVPTYSDQYRLATEDKRLHTKYFVDHNYTKKRLPPNKRQSNAPKNPFLAWKRKRKEEVLETEEEIHDQVHLCVEDLKDKIVLNENEFQVFNDDEYTDEITSFLYDDHHYDETREDLMSPVEVMTSLEGKMEVEETTGLVKESEIKLASMSLSEEDCVRIADKIVDRMSEKEKLKTEMEEETAFSQKLRTLKETEEQYICMCCINFSHSEKVPKKLRANRAGNFGFFKKLDSTRNVNKERRESIKKHFRYPLHQWCEEYEKSKKLKDEEFNKKNTEACSRVIMNAIYCFKYSLSSVDFVRLNDKDQLCIPDSSATRNDGAEQFYYFRDLVYENLKKLIKQVFQSVDSASFSLDKVTVQKVPYTVLISYFFYEGFIHVIMNSLHVMKSDEYDGVGTARMVGLDLMASLGLTRKRISEMFHHSVYDGVYATPEERAHGGGCLSMLKHLADWCGMDHNELTGLWDMGHKLQLVYGDAMLPDSNVKKLNKLVFSTMGDYMHGQSSLQFKEASQELNHATQSNKGSQDTRWVRANLRAFQSYFRNLPTLYTMVGREESGYAEAGDITHQKISKKKREELADGRMLAFAVGICQLLDSYSDASLDAQHVSFFPTSVMKSVNQLDEKLKRWEEEWEWEESLRYTTIGSPKQIINDLKSGVYRPNVTDGAKRSAVRRMTVNTKHHNYNITELQHDWDTVCEYFDGEGLQTAEITINDIVIGEVPVVGFDDIVEERVKQDLEHICSNLVLALDQRLKTPPFFIAAFEAFDSCEKWYDVDKFATEDQFKVMKQKIQKLVGEIKGSRNETFTKFIDEITSGYNLFLKHHCDKQKLEKEITLEDSYRSFWKHFHEIPQAANFIELFQYVQVKSYSEAICESIGSIMNMATSSGRNLHPDNFAREIFLRFNLPPLHTLAQKFIPEMVLQETCLKKKEYLRRGDGVDRQMRKFKYADISSSIGNFRKKEEEKFKGVGVGI